MTEDIFDAERQEQFFACILNSLTTGIFVTDKDYIVRFINEAYANYLGFPREEIIGRPITDFIPDSSAPRVTASGIAEMGKLRTIKNQEGERVIVVNRLPFKHQGRVLGMLASAVFSSREEFNVVAKRVELLDKQVARYARRMKSALSPRYCLDSIKGTSRTIRHFRDMLVQYARTELSVLITGATGTGKELAACAIHCESQRREGPFVSINCAAIPKELVESELFGYVGGAFSGAHKDGKAGLIALADGGTLFLDEIADMPLPAQAKLLRVLEEHILFRVGSTEPREVDFRLVAATNRDLKKLLAKGLFRQDLYYRVSPAILKIPCLCERREDIPPLIEHFLERMGKGDVQITDSAMEVLMSYGWPGNIRELRNVIASALGLCKDGIIDMSVLSPELFSDHGTLQECAPQPSAKNLQSILAENELRLIILTLQEQGWNMTRSATALGISRATLYEKLKRYGLSRDNCIYLSRQAGVGGSSGARSRQQE
ncbi:MAG: sigma 54-interacting transcriptional regulator [Desulfovibrio sp.]|jgi:PAS domain S-box-containing protein|nr:sigma 54-interacting transcriptional regulator [Desulfovibrio sp.]